MIDWRLFVAILVASLAWGASAKAQTEEPCPDPFVAHDDTTEYVTHRGAQIYTMRLQTPEADPGELLSCSIQIGLVMLLTIPSPASDSCYVENVFVVTGRHVVTRWCTTGTGDTDVLTTTAKFRVPGPKLF
jgi:hypothetical protein